MLSRWDCAWSVPKDASARRYNNRFLMISWFGKSGRDIIEGIVCEFIIYFWFIRHLEWRCSGKKNQWTNSIFWVITDKCNEENCLWFHWWKVLWTKAYMCCTIFSSLQMSDEPRMNLKLLLSAKLQNATISLSAMPINRRCGLLFGKVSPPFRLSFIGCPLTRENGRHEIWPNVFFKPLRALEYGEFYWFSWIGSPYTTAVRQKNACEEQKEGNFRWSKMNQPV